MATSESNKWVRPAEEFDGQVGSAFQRFADHANLSKLLSLRAVAVGCGSVGSWCTLAAAKTGLTDWLVVDFDRVEIQNVANQIWGPGHLGKSKSSLMAGLLRSAGFSKAVEFHDRAFEDTDLAGRQIVLSCVDNMKARKQVFDAAVEIGDAKFMFDARTGGGFLKVFMFDPSDPKSRSAYAKTLHTDGAAAAEFKCTDIGGVSAPMMAAAALSTGLAKFSSGEWKSVYLYGRVGTDFVLISNTLGSMKMVPFIAPATQKPGAPVPVEPVSRPKAYMEEPDILKNLQARMGVKPTSPDLPSPVSA